MAIRQTAIGLILAGAAWAQQFPVHHQHLRKFCAGTLTVDEKGITFQGPKKHVWTWPYQDIQQLTLTPQSIHILGYKDSNLKLGKDEAYTFTGTIPAAALYARWSAALDQRFVAGLGNIYASEALHLAGLSPLRRSLTLAAAAGLPTPGAVRLAAAIRTVLREAIARKERPYRAGRFRVYEREGESCRTPGCPGTIRRISQAGRSTFYCPACQR